MKSKVHILALIIVSFLFDTPLPAENFSHQNPPHGWMDQNDVIIDGNDFYIETNAGRVKLTVMEYDAQKNRYLIECVSFDGESFYPPPKSFSEEDES